jgi:tetratricopeptide (TPR) repeat protein
MRELDTQIQWLCSQVPALSVLAQRHESYDPHRFWLPVDGLALRAVDDLWFEAGTERRTVLAWTGVPPHAAGVTAVALPLQAALERMFFHLQGVSRLVINPSPGEQIEGVSKLQTGLEYTLPADFGARVELDREGVAEVIGAVTHAAAGRAQRAGGMLKRARQAYRENSLFEAFYCARQERVRTGAAEAWFYELLAISFLGMAERALELYEEYPDRGSADALPLLLSARYRLLLKQVNEACTILHTLTFKPEVAARAFTELARAFVMSGEFGRAVDAASAGLKQDPDELDGYLVRGLGQRGVSYESGEPEGLKAALADFQVVASKGGFNGAEALFHAGTVLARLGDLPAAEQSLRQSLFQRDRFASRDALIRVACLGQHRQIAAEEVDRLERLLPEMTGSLRELLQAKVAESGEAAASVQSGAGSPVYEAINGSDLRAAIAAAQRVVREEWKFPLSGTTGDLARLDELLNYYAPAGVFSDKLEYAGLAHLSREQVGRVLALYCAGVLQQGDSVKVTLRRAAAARSAARDGVWVQDRDGGEPIPLESFVNDRILLGASADNFSRLDSLAAEFGVPEDGTSAEVVAWRAATSEQVEFFRQEGAWAKQRLVAAGAQVDGTLADLAEIDGCIDALFEPGGELSARGAEVVGAAERDRFVVGLGLYMGDLLGSPVQARWYQHPNPEGLSLVGSGVGRLFPIALVQRRAYLATAADFGAQLGPLALGVATAVVQRDVQAGKCRTVAQVRKRLLEVAPAFKGFPREELDALADSLMSG